MTGGAGGAAAAPAGSENAAREVSGQSRRAYTHADITGIAARQHCAFLSLKTSSLLSM